MTTSNIIALNNAEALVHRTIVDMRDSDSEDEVRITANTVTTRLKRSGVEATVKEIRAIMSTLVKLELIRRSEGEVYWINNNGYVPEVVEMDQVMVKPGTTVNMVVSEIEGHPQVGDVQYKGVARKVYMGFWGGMPCWKLADDDQDEQYLYCYDKTMPIEQDEEAL